VTIYYKEDPRKKATGSSTLATAAPKQTGQPGATAMRPLPPTPTVQKPGAAKMAVAPTPSVSPSRVAPKTNAAPAPSVANPSVAPKTNVAPSPSVPKTSQPPKTNVASAPGVANATAESKAGFPSMGRIENADWATIGPVLSSYGITNPLEVTRLKEYVNKNAANPEAKIRGIPDLIGRVLGSKRLDQIAEATRGENAKRARDVKEADKDLVRVGRGDNRYPHEIKAEGGLFGWDAGVVSIEHARQMVKKVVDMPAKTQSDWVDRWKRPTPPPEERNPWVATGILSAEKKGGQKGGNGEYVAELPLIFVPTQQGTMWVGTDTGNIDTATVIGVKLEQKGNADEIIVLTGIPWKYIQTWDGIEKNKAAEQTKASGKSFLRKYQENQ
jgi:hypothetical protein